MTINIKTGNYVPVTTPLDEIRVLEDQASTPFSLYGDDWDSGDAASLTVVITSLPTKGKLVQLGERELSGPVPISIAFPLPHTFYYQAINNLNLEDSFTFYVYDNLGARGQEETVKVFVVPVNDAPVASLTLITTDEDTEVVVPKIDTSDVEGDRVYIIIDSLPLGQLYQMDGTKITAVGTELSDLNNGFRYVPALDGNGKPYTSFKYHATDKQAENTTSTSYTVKINVNPVNDAPLALPGSATMVEDGPAGAFALPMSDVDSTTLTAIIATLPPANYGELLDLSGARIQVGQRIAQNTQIKFQHKQYSHGTFSFTFFANDGLLDSVAPGTFTITVTHVNHDPTISIASSVRTLQSVAIPISFTVVEHDVGDAVAITFFSQVTGTGGSYTLDTVPSSFVADGNTKTFTFTYNPPFTASGDNYASIGVRVTDPAGKSASSSVIIHVSPRANVPPTADAISITATQDFVTAPFRLTGTDADDTDSYRLKFYITAAPSQGTLFVNGKEAKYPQFVDTADEVTYLTTKRGSDSFPFYAMDTMNAKSTPSAVTITILNTNHMPVLMV